MARQFARVKVSIWSDDGWRTLSPAAQHLYFMLLTSPSLSHCGVADWRPVRIAALAGGWSVDEVEDAAAELRERLFLVVDEDTEEVLIRSFLRHDGLMDQPKMAVAMAKAHAGIASKTLRGVVVHELIRLHDDHPTLRGWGSVKASEVLTKGSVDPSTYPLGKGSRKGIGSGNTNPSGKGSGKGCPTPTPTPTPTPKNLFAADDDDTSPSDTTAADAAPAKKGSRGTRIDTVLDDGRFTVTQAMRDWHAKNAPNVDGPRETEQFVDYWTARSGKDATKVDWVATWRTWMRNAQGKARPGNARPVRPGGVQR